MKPNKKIDKKKKDEVKREPVNYIVVISPDMDTFSLMLYGGDVIHYFFDLKDVMRFVKDNRTVKQIRVFQVGEELKVKAHLELEL